MDYTNQIIRKVITPSYRQVVIETNDNRRYYADLSSFDRVHCFPKNFEEWKLVHVDKDGIDLVWSTRFEVHVDQVIQLANHVEPISQIAR